MKRAMDRMEKALFVEGIDDVTKSLEIMGKSDPPLAPTILASSPEAEALKKDLKIAVAYKVALLLLVELEILKKDEEKNLVTSALLTKFLAYLPLYSRFILTSGSIESLDTELFA